MKNWRNIQTHYLKTDPDLDCPSNTLEDWYAARRYRCSNSPTDCGFMIQTAKKIWKSRGPNIDREEFDLFIIAIWLELFKGNNIRRFHDLFVMTFTRRLRYATSFESSRANKTHYDSSVDLYSVPCDKPIFKVDRQSYKTNLEQVGRAIELLEPIERTLVQLILFEGRSLEDAANQSGLSSKSLRNRYSKDKLLKMIKCNITMD